MARQHIFRPIFEKIDPFKHKKEVSARTKKDATRPKAEAQASAAKSVSDKRSAQFERREEQREQKLSEALKRGELTKEELDLIPEFKEISTANWAHFPYIDKVLQMRQLIDEEKWEEAGIYFIDKKKFDEPFALAVASMFDNHYSYELHPPRNEAPWAENLFDITVPHLLFTYNDGTNEYKFAVQTIWRSRFTKHGLSLMSRSQLIKCKLFEQETNIPVFMIFGIGGETSEKPDRIFVYPIKDMPNHFIPKPIAYENEYDTNLKFRYIPEIQSIRQ